MTVLSQAALELSQFADPPYATFAIIAISLVLGLVTSLMGIRSMDMEAYKKLTVESHRVRQELMDATKSGNQRRIAKAQNRQQELMSQQSKISMDRMKSSLFFTLPLLLIWPTLGKFFGDTVVAYFPFSFPRIPRELTFISWYLLCSVSFNIILNRVFGLSFEIDPED